MYEWYRKFIVVIFSTSWCVFGKCKELVCGKWRYIVLWVEEGYY